MFRLFSVRYAYPIVSRHPDSESEKPLHLNNGFIAVFITGCITDLGCSVEGFTLQSLCVVVVKLLKVLHLRIAEPTPELRHFWGANRLSLLAQDWLTVV